MSVELSLVVPLYNEEENLKLLWERIRESVDRMGVSYECIFVDDGSRDGSRAVLLELKKNHPQIRLVLLRRNFGQTAALSAGFEQALGDWVITLDADLQNDPADIPKILEGLKQGHDLVSGWRVHRKDPFHRRLPSQIANRIISLVTGVKLHDYGCTLKGYRLNVVKELHLYGEMHRFIPALASWSGISILEIPVSHHPRLRGKSKYGIGRTLRVILDLLTVKFLLQYFSASPIQMFGSIGFVSCGFGFLSMVVAVILKWVEHRTLTGNPLFYLFIFMEVLGIQLILIGLLAEVNTRTYYESQKKKTYVIKEVI